MIESESEDEEITASDEEFLESEIQGNLRTHISFGQMLIYVLLFHLLIFT